MTPEEQRIAIAEAHLGYKPKGDHWQHCRDGSYRSPDKLPDYLNDLNAMHEAEKVLQESPEMWEHYTEELMDIVVRDNPEDCFLRHISATSSQRAEAFLRTIGKWKQ